MPPKKSSGILDVLGMLIFQVLLLPFTLVWKCVTIPTHYVIYVLVDIAGAEVIRKRKIVDQQTQEMKVEESREYWWPWLMGKNSKDKKGGILKIKKVISYLKELRYVLYDFGWTKVPSPGWRCKGCPKKAEWYCVDCNKKFCPQCAYNMHAPDLMFLVFAIRLGYFHQIYNEDYLETQMICPVVNEARTFIGYLDTTLMYHYKDSFFSWCDTEDSYMRFLMDTWVRTIVTQTDNVLLIFQMFPKALFFNVVIMYTVVPAVSLVYAAIVNITYHLECMLPDDEKYREWERIARRISISEHIADGNSTGSPPTTTRRQRSHMDVMDWFQYEYQRKTRHIKYYYSTSLAGLSKITWRALMFILFFRLACLYLGLAGPVRLLCRLIPGLRTTLPLHEIWYARANRMVVTESTLMQILMKMWSVVESLAPKFVKRYTVGLSYLGVVSMIGFFALCHHLVKERRKFYEMFYGDGEKCEKKVVEFRQDKVLEPRATG